jgi:hypothetical protein
MVVKKPGQSNKSCQKKKGRYWILLFIGAILQQNPNQGDYHLDLLLSKFCGADSNFSRISSSDTVRAASTTVRDGKSDFQPYAAKTA